MTMSMNEIECALRELRLSGIRATLETRVLQAQAIQEPFLDTFSLTCKTNWTGAVRACWNGDTKKAVLRARGSA